MKKVWITLVVLMLSASATLFAQEKNPKTMIQDRIDYMKANLLLTGSESQQFWGVYEQFLNDEMKVMNTYRKNIEKQGIKLGAPGTNKEAIEKLTDKQLAYLQDQKLEMRKNLLNLEISYHKKYKAFMTPRHLQDLYNLEYKYKRELTKKKAESKKDTSGPVNTGKKKR